MITTLAVVIAATLGPPEPPPDFAEQLSYAEFVGTDDEAQIIAYDDGGEVIGTIALWVEPDGEIHVASDYADGYAEAVVTDGRARMDATLPELVIAARADAIVSALGPQERKSGFWCAVGVGTTIGICAGAAASGGLLFVGCAASAAGTTCKCISAWAELQGKRKCAE